MEEEKKKTKEVEIKTKSPMWIVVLVAMLVIALACEFVYIRRLKISNQEQTQTQTQAEQTENNNSNTEKIEDNNTEKTYTCDELKGTYELTKKFKDNVDEPNTAYYSLYLYSDGTYLYDYSVDVGCGIMGNYIINGNEIILNKLFSHGSDVGVTKDKGQIKLTINDDGSLTDKNNLLEISELSNINLKKESSSISKDIPSLSEYVGAYISYLENEMNQ